MPLRVENAIDMHCHFCPDVFGGICTDQPTGGMNVFAVEMALRMGARIDWLPTVNSHQDYLAGLGVRMGVEGEGIKVVDDEGQPTPERQKEGLSEADLTQMAAAKPAELLGLYSI